MVSDEQCRQHYQVVNGGTVLGVAAVPAVVSDDHASALVHAYGETTGPRLIPSTVDGLIWASPMVILYSARRGVRVPVLARWLLGLGVAATLAANVAHGNVNGPIDAAVGAWPALASVGSYELLMRSSEACSLTLPQKPEPPTTLYRPSIHYVRKPPKNSPKKWSQAASRLSAHPRKTPHRPTPCPPGTHAPARLASGQPG
jgi:hypothetical protein